MLCGQAFAAPAPALPANADIRDSGFVYCVSGQVNTFNPLKERTISGAYFLFDHRAELYLINIK
ncbi:hypothetical protein A3N43_04500 [Klebsiella aerogenes]|nr:hypothetical protein A3N43_04500 [Klebsiella aerogenes]